MSGQPDSNRSGGPTAACAMIEPLLPAFRIGALDRAQEQIVAAHVATCPRCSARLRQLAQSGWAPARSDLGQPDNPPQAGPYPSYGGHGQRQPGMLDRTWDEGEPAGSHPAVSPAPPGQPAATPFPPPWGQPPAAPAGPSAPAWSPQPGAPSPPARVGPAATRPASSWDAPVSRHAASPHTPGGWLTPPADEATIAMSDTFPTFPAAADARAHGKMPELLRPPTLWFSLTAALGVVVVASMFLLSLAHVARPQAGARATATVGHSTPLPSATPSALPTFNLPAFHDWRAAYVAPDGRVHVSALNGQTDIVGPAIDPNIGALPSSIAVSPDGHYLAYVVGTGQSSGAQRAGPIIIADLKGAESGMPASVSLPVLATSIFWSPDSTRIAFSGSVNNVYNLYIVSVIPGAFRGKNIDSQPLPGPLGAYSTLVGWLDNGHLVASVPMGTILSPLPQPTPSPTSPSVPTPTTTPVSIPTASPTGVASPSPNASASALAPGVASRGAPLIAQMSSGPQPLASIDVTTGDGFALGMRNSNAQVYLSPDGSEILAAGTENGCAPCSTSTPSDWIATRIATATGEVFPLPNTTSLLSTPGNLVQWQPGTHIVSASVNSPTHSTNFSVYLVDTDHDTAQQLVANKYAIGWSPDGQTLLLGDPAGFGGGATTVWALRPATPGGAQVTLPQPMVFFLGFVRTA